jgi:hypothetical protein
MVVAGVTTGYRVASEMGDLGEAVGARHVIDREDSVSPT